ncbi:FAD-binding oxidoreductase [Buchnera aphidicola]|uniref:FAD-binding oxidoreductase n=1 Tax=Buchnera aphidicola TaxID=9 RepID=UPI003464A990
MTEWVNAKVIKNKKWNQKLFKIILHAPISPFIAGQFSKFSIKNHENKNIYRIYSYVNAPNNTNLEFCITRIPNGIMTNQLYRLKPGDIINISKYSAGFFTINEIPSCEILWMFATGTAVGPFCSILQDGKGLDKFKKIILTYATKYKDELIYKKLIQKIQKKYYNKLILQTITSQEKDPGSLQGRIPKLLKNQAIENNVGYIMHKNNSHVMLCGNPDMVKDTTSVLIKYKNLQKHFRRKPGHISQENYW